MGVFGGLKLTNKGIALQTKLLAGGTLHYNRMAMGDGTLAGSSSTLTALVNQKASLDIVKVKTMPGGQAVVGAKMSNAAIGTGFYFREIGLFAQDPDEGEILYCYGNAGSSADFIAPGTGGSDGIEKYIDVVSLVGNASTVTATINTSLVTVSLDDFNAHAELTAGAHGATSAATVNRIIQRDASGRAKVAAPAAADDIARKDTIDTHAAVTSNAHGATSAATPNTPIQRDAAARAKVAAPAAADDIARKDTVDAVQSNLSEHIGSNGAAVHAVATTSTAGFQSAADKSKLDNIAAGANNYVHPTSDGNLHVPATGTANNGKVLKAGATVGSAYWSNVAFSELTNKPTTLAGYGISDAVQTRLNNGKLEYWNGSAWIQAGKRAASGTGIATAGEYVTVGGLAFAPSKVFVMAWGNDGLGNSFTMNIMSSSADLYAAQSGSSMSSSVSLAMNYFNGDAYTYDNNANVYISGTSFKFWTYRFGTGSRYMWFAYE